ncbi:putative RecA/RadA family phage recombinase [Curtobacterium luteum]|uniref:RecA/RadA family phage recombinase n=1 Tax=Curtobacterium luteum TaxID=33881 RepID=A0A8H9KWZ0_9MICO|nr:MULTISPECIES: hypothetical protein [Curtobacterium]MBM7801672.1 putative RecA/RadA family phage recombinase [Curtobacterium luteum]NUU52006.1 hypothetical protein [Curtobacterium luteum]GGK88610.1 hypothetical protein GCM10009769_03320 [Curtobacterium luteum]
MSTERPGGQLDPEDDDLDRAFGPDTGSVTIRTTPQRVRRGALVTVGVVLAAGVLVIALGTIISSVQNGVGGVFPQPEAALARFDTAARAVDGVRSVEGVRTVKTGFASYDVVSVATAEDGLAPDAQDDLVAALSAAAATTGGNGVRVFAVVQLDTMRVGLSADADVTAARLDLARRVDAIGGVRAVRCAWATDAPSDEATAQEVTLQTIGRGAALDAVMAKAQESTQAAFRGATVTAVRPPA